MTAAGLPRTLVVLASNRRRGAELRGEALAVELRNRGVDATGIAIENAGGDQAIDVDVLGGSHRSPSTLRQLRRHARGYDVVIAHGSTSLPACVIALAGLRRPKLVYRSIGRPRDWIRGELHRWRTAALFSRCDHVVTLWSGADEDITRLFRVAPERTSSIPSGFSLDSWTSLDRTPSSRSPGARLRLAIIGQLAPEKAVDRAISAVAMVPGAELVIVGDGPLRAALYAQVAGLDPEAQARISFTGSVIDVRPILAESSALLVTSHTEGMPGVLIEAGLMSLPTLAVDVGAVSMMIEHGVTGVVMSSNAPDVVASQITEWRDRIESMGPAAEQRMRSMFGWDVVAPQWIELLRRLNQ